MAAMLQMTATKTRYPARIFVCNFIICFYSLLLSQKNYANGFSVSLSSGLVVVQPPEGATALNFQLSPAGSPLHPRHPHPAPDCCPSCRTKVRSIPVGRYPLLPDAVETGLCTIACLQRDARPGAAAVLVVKSHTIAIIITFSYLEIAG